MSEEVKEDKKKEEVIAYMKKHNLESTLQDALQGLKGQPGNPYKALVCCAAAIS